MNEMNCCSYFQIPKCFKQDSLPMEIRVAQLSDVLCRSFLAYKDLSHRKKAREIMWQEPAWGDCVANTG